MRNECMMQGVLDHKWMLIFVVLVGHLAGYASAGTVVLMREYQNWTQSRDRCASDLNGTLTNMDIANQDTRSVLQNCMASGERAWLGNYSTVSPLMVMEGCFSRNNVPVDTFISVELTGSVPSVRRCEQKCNVHPGGRFGVQRRECLCFNQSDREPSTITVGECGILCDQNAFCGGDQSFSLYTVANKTGQTFIDLSCSGFKCDSKGITYFGYENCRTKLRGVCESGILTNTTLTWWEAQQFCIKQTKWPLITAMSCDNVTNTIDPHWYGEFRSEEFLSVREDDDQSPVRASIIVCGVNGNFSLEASGVESNSSFYLCETDDFNASSIHPNVSVCGKLSSSPSSSSTSASVTIPGSDDITRIAISNGLGNYIGLFVGGGILFVIIVSMVTSAILLIRRKRNLRKGSILYSEPEVMYSAVTRSTDASDGDSLNNSDVNIQKSKDQSIHMYSGVSTVDVNVRTQDSQKNKPKESEQSTYDSCHRNTEFDFDPAYDSTRNMRNSVENAYDVSARHGNQGFEGHYDTSEVMREGIYDHSKTEPFTKKNSENIYES